MLSPEQKNIVDWIVNKFIKVIDIEPFRNKVGDFIQSEYLSGIEKAGVQFRMNFVPKESDVKFLNNYVFENLKKHTDDIGESLRGELSRGIMNKEDIPKLKKRVREVFKDKKFSNRLKAVLRTEKIRANNYGALQGAEQSGLKLGKYVDVIMDSRTSPICKAENRKYGKKEKAIPLDNEFIVKAENKTYSAQSPPFHPNCRTTIRFIKEEE